MLAVRHVFFAVFILLKTWHILAILWNRNNHYVEIMLPVLYDVIPSAEKKKTHSGYFYFQSVSEYVLLLLFCFFFMKKITLCPNLEGMFWGASRGGKKCHKTLQSHLYLVNKASLMQSACGRMCFLWASACVCLSHTLSVIYCSSNTLPFLSAGRLPWWSRLQ